VVGVDILWVGKY